MRRRVVVTGMGTINALGLNTEESWSAFLEGKSGLTSVVRILEGKGVKMLKAQKEAEIELQSYIKDHELEVFPLVLAVPDFKVGLQTLVQAFGIIYMWYKYSFLQGILRIIHPSFNHQYTTVY